MTQDAEDWFKEFGIASDNFQDLHSLAEMFEGEGNTKEAIKVYQHIIKYELSSDGAKHALELIWDLSHQPHFFFFFQSRYSILPEYFL